MAVMSSQPSDGSALDQKAVPAPSSEKMADLDINGVAPPREEQRLTSALGDAGPPFTEPSHASPAEAALNGAAASSKGLANGTSLDPAHHSDELSSSGAVVSASNPTESLESTQTTHTSVPPIVEAAVSDVRRPTDPVTLERATQIKEDEQERGLSNIGSTAPSDPPTAAAPDDKMDTSTDALPAEAAEAVGSTQPADDTSGIVPTSVEPAAAPAEAASPPMASDDQVMADLPASPSKNARAREDDEQEDGPATKRTRTADDGSARGDFKVPELPPLATSLPTEAEATAAPSQQSRADGSRTITKAQHRFVLSAVRNLKRTKDAQFFNVPVDPVKLGIPTYPTIVTNPMDLGTMEERLKNEKYLSVDSVTADFEQIVKNTVLFNGQEHIVTKAAQNMKATFERQMSNLPKADVVEPTPAEKKAKKAGTPKSMPARRESRSSTGVAKSPTNNAGSPTTFALGPSGTPLIRRDSTVADGRPKREIHPPPPRDLPYSTSKPKKKKFQWELKFCQEALNELHKGKYGQLADPFRYPVDPVALNIPHYHKIVKKPMDMSTIGTKLKNGEYENAKEFEADVRLMFQNCYKFNPKGDPINSMGKQLEAIFDEKWSTKAQWIDDHAPVSSPQSLATSPEPDDEEEEDEDEEDEEDSRIDMFQQQIDAMKEHLELLRKKKAAPAVAGKKGQKGTKPGKKPGKKAAVERPTTKPGAAKADKKKKKATKKDRTPYITYEQKQEISNRINTLPPNRMTTALKIIRDNMPNLKGIQDDELELDIDELSDEVLHKLYQFVQKYAPGGDHQEESKPARPKAAPESRAGASSRPKKNKPMSKTEQEARISELQGKLKSYQNAGSDESPEPVQQHAEAESSDDDDDDESGSESEEE
ncbi:MAG: hypothetical protein M1832_001637 [Thelocarpon impressellum]|nr:MAG: hypothetical protein M1832_001637 [Thelocarpon impressellum]